MKAKKLPRGFEDLELVLRSLDFLSNFGGHEISLTITAGTEASISNPFKPIIPTRWIEVDKRRRNNSSGTINVTRGDTDWTADRLYFKNHGTVGAVVKIILLP